VRRIRTIQRAAVAVAAGGCLAGTAPPALAGIDCGRGELYKRVKVRRHFVPVDSVRAVNRRKGTATIAVQVGVQHTSSRTFTGSITVGAEAGFWIFAKAKAEATASIALLRSTTMFSTYTVTAQVPGHSARTVTFGFTKYDQLIRRYHYVNSSPTTCRRVYDAKGWVRAPVRKTFRIS
jgi:hypothetical protein